ncbi:outer membrane protein OmpA-like peptidoglycan-associated protein/tetratricopeptide (TPR) repeat protein [Mesonia hippocampi]|uniref:Outer membrane protein OmpA-like peptidoglycan-associated protein/tetratricopeptide (TPR) repeat protein n=1 Tax=Mesonia hippocampi TaxID=1628250 RepID=A0A840ELP6_9FLAO|nr:OmpA family protein [Mesonia hippocampi]MBB4119048.1 outer membrane protein OmpA-like peptidoglycan-associated protein/tetratricopeptide (TPR) repeat protein [Mesonia hippocampi]
MKKQLQYSLTLIFLIVFSSNTVLGQDRKLRKAENRYNQYDFVDASKIYEKVVASGYVSEEILQKLGNTYYFNAKYKEAKEKYESLMELNDELEPIYYLRYAQSLRAIGENKEAEKWFDRYAKIVNISEEDFSTSIDYNQLIEENSDRYKIKNLSINTTGIDYGGGIHQGNLVYASTGDSIKKSRLKTDSWSGLGYMRLKGVNIEEADSTSFDNLGNGYKVKGDLNSKLHVSSACFTKDGKTMYFTQNILLPEKNATQAPHVLKIYRARLSEKGKWENVEGLSINSNSYSNAHPALSPNEDQLYFVSNRPGGEGETDIYVVAIDKEGNLGEVKNLGDKINTPARETFPFVSQANELYFSSDGHLGLGGLDIFYVKINDDNTYGHLLNVGTPVNSKFDDFAYTVRENTNKGFFSSNRKTDEAKGYDDIYTFVETKQIKDVLSTTICGQVIDIQTKEPIHNASVSLLNRDNEVQNTVKTDSLGNYCMEAERFKHYLVRATEETYDADEQMLETKEEKHEVNFELRRNKVPLEPGQDLAKVLNIPIIYFDFDKSNIRPDAAIELEKVVAVLQEYPFLKIDIRSHTDSRGRDAYNMALSERRAQSTLNYMVKRGIDKERLTAKGYGETRLVNNCANGVPCSKEEHQLNRRSEFIVIE